MIIKVPSNPNCSMILTPHVSALDDFRIIRIVSRMTASPTAHLYVKNSNDQMFLKKTELLVNHLKRPVYPC